MIQQMLVVVNQDKFMLQRAIFHSDQETYEVSSYMALVTDKEKHNVIQQMLVVVNQDKFMMQRAIT